MTGSIKTNRPLLLRGIDCLSRREYSRAELRRKLEQGLQPEESADSVDECLDALQAKGYLSDDRYAEARVRLRAARYGNARLEQELRMNGLDSQTIETAMQEAGSELDRAREVWQRRFGAAPADSRQRAQQIRFLAARGFSFSVIAKVVPSTDCSETFE